MKYFTHAEFLKRFPTDDACLETLKNLQYPDGVFCKRCKCVQTFYRIKKRPAYECAVCSFQIYPLKGTILEKSTTKLTTWFYVIFIVSQTRCSVSAKTIERETGVSYKCAWRMLKQIRISMGESIDPLTGVVEVDESFFGGAGKNRRYVANFNEKPKDIIMGMVERKGQVIMRKIATTGKQALLEQIEKHIDQKATVMHDEFVGYKNLHKVGYDHHAVNHGKTFVTDKVVHTENIEGLWGRIKPAVKGVYRKVTSKYIESYMNEYCFRYNHRKIPGQMFDLLLLHVAST